MGEDAITARLGALRPESPARWGTMTAGEMVVHCADQIRVCRGEKAITSMRIPKLLRPLLRWVFVTRKKAFKPGMKTLKELDARGGMTPITTFENDRQTLLQMVAQGSGQRTVDHPLFGKLSGDEAEDLSRRHLDYHLRQFGV